MPSPRKVQRAFTGLVGLPPEPNEAAVVPAPAAVAVAEPFLSESQVGALLGVAPPRPPRPLPVVSPKFPSMRQTLMLDAEDLIALFDESPATKIGEREVFEETNFLVPPQMLQHRIERLKKLIAESKTIVDGLSVHKMKLRRDEVLDKATREKFKREENSRIARSNVKLSRYRNALRTGNYREKIWCYQTQPVYFRNVVDDAMTFTDRGEAYYVPDKQKLGYWTTNMVCDVTQSGIYDVSRYEVVMQLDDNALRLLGESEEQQKRSWGYWQRWENAVVKAAVFHGVLHPRQDLLDLLGLLPYVQAALDATESEIEADETENALALKTGGACYNGVIHGAGYRYNRETGAFRRRSLEDFDKEAPKKDWDSVKPRGADSGFTSMRNVNDDAESYDPR